MKAKLQRLILMGIVFTGVSIFVARGNLVLGIIGIVFFGGCCIIYIIKYFMPDFAPRMDSSLMSDEPFDREKFQERYDDFGIFKYNKDGFSIKFEEELRHVKWSQVRTMVGYKVDRFTVDAICLNVHCDPVDLSFSVNEETPGWFQFLIKTKEQFPSIDNYWEGKIAAPAFETNLTVIYDYLNRSVEEVETMYYQKK